MYKQYGNKKQSDVKNMTEDELFEAATREDGCLAGLRRVCESYVVPDGPDKVKIWNSFYYCCIKPCVFGQTDPDYKGFKFVHDVAIHNWLYERGSRSILIDGFLKIIRKNGFPF